VTVTPQLREAGDSALLLQLAPVIDPVVNAQVIAIADAVRRRGFAGVRDVVATFHSVAVYFDPLRADAEMIDAALREAVRSKPTLPSGRRHEIPVAYGGEDGPDLESVATQVGVTPAEVIERHARTDYRVFMLGFQPGFAYMGLIDPVIAVPRRASPRLKVPGGSVGIAGRQTGIYPSASPGGWQIIGRALDAVFDQRASPPARFAPGDIVAFIPAQPGIARPPSGVHAARPTDPSVFTVLRPGLFTTVQDSGVWGMQGLGVPVGGAMDLVSHAIANAAVGNPTSAATLEVTLGGLELRAQRDATVAIAGADLSATLDNHRLRLQTAVTCQSGSVLRFGTRGRGSRAYLALAGGFRNERSYAVQPLSAGQALATEGLTTGAARQLRALVSPPAGGTRLRVLPGPQHDQLSAGCLDALCADRFTVSPQSNRVGYRLTGPMLPGATGEMISDATFPGAVQVTPSGQAILLMADRQTTGGYPQVAVVISADLGLAGQLAPGDWIEFVLCSHAEARAALVAQEAMLNGAR
jgi:KipI family sensor histidine kinase inhibitor